MCQTSPINRGLQRYCRKVLLLLKYQQGSSYYLLFKKLNKIFLILKLGRNKFITLSSKGSASCLILDLQIYCSIIDKA